MAMRKPELNSANSRMALRRFSAISLSSRPRRNVRYALARRFERPTRPRSWCSWARPMRSASSMMRVFTFGMSMPVSMMVVQTRICVSPVTMRSMTVESCSSFIWPCATSTTAPSSIFEMRRAVRSMFSMRLCR